MKVVGIIAEYNPYHRGHLYHMEQAKAITGADCCIAVMSGDYVQRGTPAILDKYLRTRMALSCGTDLVLELPLPFACGSAEYFASGAVSLLSSLGCVDYLCFGSEAGDITPFSRIAPLLADESSLYQRKLQCLLRQGLSFPAARAKALSQTPGCDDLNDFLFSPNNILGLEYVKAILRQKAALIPVTIQRKGEGYHSKLAGETFSSASAVRQVLEEGKDPSFCNASMPLPAYDLMINHLGIRGPVTADDFSLLLKYKLMEETRDSLSRFWEVSDALAARICRCLNSFSTVTDFAGQLKSKDMTYTRVCRALLHVLLGLTKEKIPDRAEYGRVLGFAKDTPVLKAVKSHSRIPIITKPADASKVLSPSALVFWEQDIRGANLYETVSAHKFGRRFVHEYQQSPVIWS